MSTKVSLAMAVVALGLSTLAVHTAMNGRAFRRAEPVALHGFKAEVEGRLADVERRVSRVVEAVDEQERSEPVERAPDADKETVPDESPPNDVEDRIAALEEAMEQLRTDVLAAFDSVSPIEPLDSAEAEEARAELFEERKMYNTAVRAYLALLQRYPDYAASGLVARKALKAYRLDPDRSPRPLRSIEEALRRYPNEDSFDKDLYDLGQRYANAKQHADTVRILREVIKRRGATDRLKVEAYWTLAFAVRETEDEAAFLETLETGRNLASTSGLPTDSFDHEIADPRPRNP